MNSITNTITAEWGIDQFTPEEQLDILERVGALVYQAILVRASESLVDIDKVEFELMLGEEGQNPEDVLLFLDKKIPHFSEIIQEETQKVKKELGK